MDRYLSALAELWPTVLYTGLQSTFSALFTLFLASIASLGLLAFTGRARQGLNIIYLLPSMLPPIFILISSLALFSGRLPFGWPLLVAIHTLMNVGVCAYILSLAFEQRTSSMIELGLIEGASTTELLMQALIGPLSSVVKSLFWLVFLFSWMSFSIAIQLGGLEGATPEVLIFEKIRSGVDFQEAMFLSFVQFLFLFVLGAVILKKEKLKWPQKSWPLRHFGAKALAIFGIAPLLFFALGFLKGFKPESFAFFQTAEWQEVGFTLIAHTLYVGFGVALCTGAFILFLCALWPSPFFRFLFSGVTQVSTSLLGLCFLYQGYEDWVLYKLIFGLSLFTIPWLYRFRIESALDELESQILNAKSLGASSIQILLMISGPQLLPDILIAMGLAAFFAMGDFGFSIFVTGTEPTLSVFIENLLSSYRLEPALGVLTLLLALSTGVLVMFGGLSDVARRKLN